MSDEGEGDFVGAGLSQCCPDKVALLVRTGYGTQVHIGLSVGAARLLATQLMMLADLVAPKAKGESS